MYSLMGKNATHHLPPSDTHCKASDCFDPVHDVEMMVKVNERHHPDRVAQAQSLEQVAAFLCSSLSKPQASTAKYFSRKEPSRLRHRRVSI